MSCKVYARVCESVAFVNAMEPKATPNVYYYFIKIFSSVRGIIEDFFSLNLIETNSSSTFELAVANTRHGRCVAGVSFLAIWNKIEV